MVSTAKVAFEALDVLGTGDGSPVAKVAAVYVQILHTLDESPWPVGPGLLSDFVNGSGGAAAYAASVERRVYPTYPIGEAPEVYPVRAKLPKLTRKDVERNPYSAQVPDSIQDSREQQRILRDQHNRQQAGDSTFDAGLLLKYTPNKLYTLGSMGRFYHESHGIIIARYVRFKDMLDSDYQGAPCGRLKSNSDTVDWTVTNDFTKSGPGLVEGVCFIADVPPDDSYGWLVTHGANPADMGPDAITTPAQDVPYYWTKSGYVGLAGTGRPVGYRWGKALNSGLQAGRFMVSMGSHESALLKAEVTAALDQLTTSVNQLAAIDEGHDNSIEGLTTSIANVSASLQVLTAKLAREEAMRVRDVASIRNELFGGTDWSVAIRAEANNVRGEFQQADDAIRSMAYNAVAAVAALQATLNGINFTDMTSRLDGIEQLVLGISSRALNYIVPFGFTTTPSASEVLLLKTFADSVTFKQDFAGSHLDVGTNPAATYVLTIYKNGVSVGTISISTSGVGTFSSSGLEVEFAAGDVMKIEGAATAPTSLANVSAALKGTMI